MPPRLSEYFVSEAGEYLDQLDALLAAGGAPEPPRLFRLARGVRGSAQLAEARAIAEVAARLEDAARRLGDGRLAWSDALRERLLRSVTDLRTLVRAVPTWGAEDERRAHEAAARWEAPPAEPRTPPDDRAAAEARLFPFLRIELLAVRMELERALAELEAEPEEAEPLRRVLKRMRAVRGVHGAASLTPLLGMLAEIEATVQQAAASPAGAAPLLAAAGDVLAAAAELLGAGGAPTTALPEWARFQRLRAGMDGAAAPAELEVVSIRRLFRAGAGPHLLESPVAPLPRAGEPPAPELLAFLRLEATALLDRARARPEAAAELAAAIGDLAATLGVAQVERAAEQVRQRVGTAATPGVASAALDELQRALAEPPLAAGPAASVEPVPVEEMLLRGPRALDAALALRPRLDALFPPAPSPELREALDELFDLLRLARETPPA